MTGRLTLTKRQAAYVKRHFADLSNRQLAEHLGMSIQKFRPQAYLLGLYRMQIEYWTDEQIKFLKRHFRRIGDKELAEIFNSKWCKEKGWTLKHIEKKRNQLNLKRTLSELEQIKQRNTKRGCWQETTTWQTRGECPEGTIRIWKRHREEGDCYKVIKVKGRFEHYGRWLFEQTFGKMKPGHVIGYKDGNNMNVVPDNLESITRAEHARRNRVLAPELREAAKLLKQLNQLIQVKTQYHVDTK